LYEIRERPSKVYHWLAFLIAAILAEIPWNLLVGTLFFFGWYFPVGKDQNFYIMSDCKDFGRMSVFQPIAPLSNGCS
jgi:ABC-type multidrug transport system permease subunit